MNPELHALRELRARQAAGEPVPMLLVLRDERAGSVPAPAGQPHAGAALAARLDELAASLAPTRRPGDLGVTETLLQTLAHESP